MRRHVSRIAWSFAWTIIVVAGLGACAMSPAYMTERLDNLPKPAGTLMVQAPIPDCASHPARVVPTKPSTSQDKKASPVSGGTDFESESENTQTSVAIEKRAEPAPQPRDAELKRLERERDCYRRAEQLARQRLDALQASSAETLAVLDDIRNDTPDAGYLTAW